MKNLKIATLLLATMLISNGCSDDDDSQDAFSPTLETAITNHANIVLATYKDSRDDVAELLAAVKVFVNAPSEDTHRNAKTAWLNAQETYGQTEVYRFYGGPIDDEDGPEGQMNAWPLDESLIDYVKGSANGDDPNIATNIINNTKLVPTITKQSILERNEQGGAETNVSVGFHAIEFLLWGIIYPAT